MFRTNDMILYKSRMCHELDRELGDIQVDIANHETRIMMRLVEALLLQASTFVHLVQRILMLDCLLSFAVVSRECGWVRPQLTKEAVLEVEDARHPLYELCHPASIAQPHQEVWASGSRYVITGNIIHLPVDFDQRGASYPILMPYTHVPWYVAQCLIPLGLTCSPKWHVLMPDVSDASY
ncbi:mutS protein homolog 5-like [Penaeus monodon]|uniref:mutS protein homolog 5-like n=1 Tax=Penaeus monodon TaxID=6687 RepID=UPI0018A6E216|nr:mutS protein homolog 5-like [Penaeus monodon]